MSLPKNSSDSWTKCKDTFIGKFFPPAKNISLRNQIMNFKQLDQEHDAQSWERKKLMLKNCLTHGLSLWMVVQNFYAGLNFVSRNLLDSATSGTFMGITLGEATKLLDNMTANYSQWHTERAPSGKKVKSVNEISSLNDKVDMIMSLLATKNTTMDLNDMSLSTLIEQNKDSVDVNFICRSNFNNKAYRGNFGNNNPRPYPGNPSNAYGNSYGNNNKIPTDLENTIEEFINSQRLSTTIEEKLSNVAAMTKILPPNKDEMPKSLKAIQVTIDYNTKIIAMLRARREREERKAELHYLANNDEEVKTIGVSPIESLFRNIKHVENNNKGTGEESTLIKRSPNYSEGDKLDAKNDKSGFGEVKTLGSVTPTILDFKEFNYDICYITECISLLQSMVNSPNTYDQNKAFTKHIVEALIKANEEKLELEVSIPRKLDDGWGPIIKIKINNFECNALCDLGASVSTMPKALYDVLGFDAMLECSLN